VIFLVVFWIFREFTDLLCVCLEKWCSCKYNLHSRIIVRRSHAGVLCDACGSWIRSPTRHAVRSPLYFNSVVTIAPNCRIVERKIMPLWNKPAGLTKMFLYSHTLTSYSFIVVRVVLEMFYCRRISIELD